MQSIDAETYALARASDAVLAVLDDLRPTVSALTGFLTLFTSAHLAHDQAQLKDACFHHCATLARQALNRLNHWDNLYTAEDGDQEGGDE